MFTAFGADLEVKLKDHFEMGGVGPMTPLGRAIRRFKPQSHDDAIKALIACGADTSCLEEIIGNHPQRELVEIPIREQVKAGQEIFAGKQLPFVRSQLQEAFATYEDGQLFGNELAPIINGYAGPLILARRVYTHEEKLSMLDELCAEEEAEEKRKQSTQQAASSVEQPK